MMNLSKRVSHNYPKCVVDGIAANRSVPPSTTYKVSFKTTAWKVSKYGVYFFILVRMSLNAGKQGPEKRPYLDTFHAVNTACTWQLQPLFYFALYYKFSKSKIINVHW